MTPPLPQPLSPLDDEEARRARLTLDDILARYTYEDGVVLVQIPQVPPTAVEAKIAQNRGYFAYPPHGLLYLAAALRDLNVETSVVDLNLEVLISANNSSDDLEAAWKMALDSALSGFMKPFVCVSYTFDPTFPQLIDVCRHVKTTRPELCVAVGGVGATADPARVIELCGADLVFANEGEAPLQQFFSYLRGETETLPTNLSFSDADGAVHFTPWITGSDVDLDIRDQYSKIEIERYFRFGSLNNLSRMRGVDVPYATVLSRRGCRAHCTFCSVRNFNGRSVRVRDPLGVVDEMEHLWNNHGIRHFEWLDDDLLYDRDSALKLFEEIARRLPDATWCANNGLIASAVTPELMEAMVASNCQGFTVGLESGNEKMLRTIRKPASLERFARFADSTKGHPQIFYLVNFILGLPGETFAQMLDSLKIGMRARLDWANLFNFQPLKNTDAYVAYAGSATDEMPAGEDELRRRSTTMNYNPQRSGAFKVIPRPDEVITGWDVFDLDPDSTPGQNQMKEIWFTFNNLINFLRLPALFTDSPDRLRNAIRWLKALQTAYVDNPSITCLIYYLSQRLNEQSRSEIEDIRTLALQKFERLEYWRHRDKEFHWTAMLDGDIPEIDDRARAFIKRHRLPMDDGAQANAEAITRNESAKRKAKRGNAP